LSATSTEKITDWKFDTGHSTFEFTVRQMRVSTIKGAFAGVIGEIHYDPDDVESSWVRVEIDVSTIDSHSAGRDESLRGERFFDVANFPTAAFASTRVEPQVDGRLLVAGDLTLKGVTSEVVFDTVFEGVQRTPNDTYRGAFTARATILRSEFGFSLGAPLEGGGFVHSDEVQLAMFTSVAPKEG
jgi:polyisoprenoid-binding protein YceI